MHYFMCSTVTRNLRVGIIHDHGIIACHKIRSEPEPWADMSCDLADAAFAASHPSGIVVGADNGDLHMTGFAGILRLGAKAADDGFHSASVSCHLKKQPLNQFSCGII